jgi:2-oxoglutarate ferredoxin oxidoreductase subunit delta
MAKGKIEVNSERCKGCELCVTVCPEQILRMSETFNRQGQRFAECFKPEGCTACLSCANICPDCAIKVWRYVKV